jgi:hypothetical protein
VKLRRAWWAAWALGFAGCVAGPDTVPFRGAQPSQIAVLPVRDAPDTAASVVDQIESGTHGMLRDRGYRAVPADVVARVEGARDEPTRELCDELVRVFSVDAVLIPELRALPGATAAGDAGLELRWTLIRAADGAVCWSATESVKPGQVTARHLGSPGSRFEADPFFQDEPQVGRGGQTWVTEVRVRTPEEQAAFLLRGLSTRLPQGAASQRL